MIHDDPEKFNGATSHEVRDHFNILAEQLPQVVNTPETLQSLVKQCEDKPIPGPEYSFGARFNFAIFVDDICLESLDHMHDPVVKILYKQWGNLTPEEKKYEIHPEWHDGETDDGEEDVGWMYMSVREYAETYNQFEWAHLSPWHDFYLRPPLMLDIYWDKESQLGFWRTKK